MSDADSSASSPSPGTPPDLPLAQRDWAGLAPQLAAIAADIQALQQRYTEADAARQTLQQVETQLNTLEPTLAATPPDSPEAAELQAEVERLQAQAEELDIAMKIQVLGESAVAIDLSELFWYAVRFMGLSVVVGWLLALVATRSPAPQPGDASRLPSAERVNPNEPVRPD